jgi:hypothetical protein
MIRLVRRANYLFDAFVETLSSTVGMGSRLLLRGCVWGRRGEVKWAIEVTTRVADSYGQCNIPSIWKLHMHVGIRGRHRCGVGFFNDRDLRL